MIRPQDLEVQFNTATKAAAGALEQRIDDELEKGYNGPDRKITVTKPMNVKQHVLEFVVNKYREQGWLVTSHSDQREGDWLEFLPGPEYDWHGH